MHRYFDFAGNGTSYRQEIMAGFSTFLAMAYIIVVNPAILGRLDIVGALSPRALPLVLIVFVMVFVDTIGTLIGLSALAGLLDDAGNLPEIEKPMLADALASMVAPFLGTTTGAYIESASGGEEGGAPVSPPS